MTTLLNGGASFGCVVAGLFFLTFWRESRDRLFLAFAAAFWIFAIDYAVLGVIPLADESRPYVFLLRLVGFVILLAGIAGKNWQSRPSAQGPRRPPPRDHPAGGPG